MYGKDILGGISKGSFEFAHKISYPYIERGDVYSVLKIYEISDLRTRNRFWKASWPQRVMHNLNKGQRQQWITLSVDIEKMYKIRWPSNQDAVYWYMFILTYPYKSTV